MRTLLAMFFAGVFFLTAAVLICFLGQEVAWYFVIASLIAGGFSQFAFQDMARRSQIASLIAAYVAMFLLIGGLVAAMLGL
ncbi:MULTISPECIES: hypothetical protein [unclassified Brucella]|uniref:hypothetical protein n=1 Tax=unclassified Brucella TaxID=2632610 RepID=UPI0012AE92B4|nr:MULTISPECIES: hypothetical protein [unclassified Brucella]MRN43481.1 hypothetical protein [Brucella sp. 09RB8913]MRN59395.1 hypothetical protein [Brucella sp. 09RB8918]MRN67949.1 hypothetical protein [Brucella sp. 10RB9213]